jgi:hypothetical protein
MLMVALRRDKEPVETHTLFVVSSALLSPGKAAMFWALDTLRGTAFAA